ncbi:AMP-binding protein [Mycobacterium sp. 1465703.0]|uniref:AMP-binding protein n=1 Tax=Mycobacterium sp. 1465703.0 TaxID=1834078 RepID=UPI000801AB16|nr:AMP-binding protein [Mycobacterium sp. 1465703.0]OBJ01012.1 acyl-CoA synthetase [Mycobacterium sp. 1465703.0]
MIYRSTLPDVEIPDVTLVEHVLRPARDRRDKVALIDAISGEKLSYGELLDVALAAAAGLAKLGVRAGDVIALISQNQPRFALATYAVMAAGAAVTPMNPALTAGEMAKQIAAANAQVVICSVEAVEKAAEAADACRVGHVFVLGDQNLPQARSFNELMTAGGAVSGPDLDPRTALAALPFSSGTTGTAKGVMLTHRNLVANIEQHALGWLLDESDVVAAVPPFFHIYGFNVVLNFALRAGATIVTLSPYSLPGYLQMVEQHRVTRAYLAPPMVLALASADEVQDYDLSSVRYGMCGGAPLDAELAAAAEIRLGCSIRQGYGMTEASPGTHAVPDAEVDAVPAGSVGRLVASTEARLVDPETGQDVPPFEPGELWVRGPQVMAGYLDNSRATADTVVADGWLRTGDIARTDDSGLYWVVDRLKELIKYKGYQVPPAELESVLLTHPDVSDVAVIGVPHREGGEAPKAFVVATRPTDADSLMRWVSDRVAPYKRVREVEFIGAIPKAASGKILRRLLKAGGA